MKNIPCPDFKKSFCEKCFRQNEVLVVEDAKNDPFYYDHVMVQSGQIGFYAGAPLFTTKGVAIGTLCVIDTKAGTFDEEQRMLLALLAKQVIMLLNLRLSLCELEQCNALLKKSNQEKNKIIGMVSHDIRQPLQNIMICTELMLADEDFKIPENHLEMMNTNHSSARLMHTMVDDLLQLVQVDFGNVPISIEPRFTDIVALVHRSVTTNFLYASRKKIAFHMGIQVSSNKRTNIRGGPDTQGGYVVSYDQWEHDFDGLPITCFVDPAKMEQVLNNLLTNAVKYSNPNTEIQIEVGRRENKAYIAVTDHGLGIPQDELGNLFIPYHKISVRPTGGETSTGLGLSIVKSVIQAHQGEIEVESTVGKGSTFRIILPLPTAPMKPVAEETKPQETKKRDSGSKLSVLVADDNAVIQRLVSSVLKKRGHSVIVADNGKEAFTAWKSGNVDVVILDEEMPRMLGSEVASAIRQVEKEDGRSRVRIISCTGHTSKVYQQKILDCGADEICNKPFEISKLVELVEHM
jgi:signal transduction histidine kinase/ActR/RegA family two-component response regulator